MPCAKPLTAYRPANGGPLLFKAPRGHYAEQIELPCGQCILCRLEHARQWAVRITHEATLHNENAFITLTYKDENLPEHAQLHYPHLQKFWKKLRKEIGPLRYFAVGEYGDESQRPHYHACLFGHAFIKGRTIVRQQPSLLWTHPLLEEIWGHGGVRIGALNFETAQYTASYVTKKIVGKRQYVRMDEETGELIPVIQPRAFMSLRPAIGKSWLELWGKNVYDHDQVIINGRPQKPPKYYDTWLKSTNESALAQTKEKRKKEAKKSTPEENAAKAVNALARKKASRRLAGKV